MQFLIQKLEKLIENKIPGIIGLIEKTVYDAKILDIDKKYVSTSDYKFKKEILNAKIKEKKLVDQSDISNLIKNSDLNTKLATLATKSQLKAEQDKIVKLQTFKSNYFCG